MAYVLIDCPFGPKMTTGTMGRVTPPPVATPASHALSCGVVDVVGFTAKFV